MTALDYIVLVQMLTMVVLAVGFWYAGQKHLAVAQMCYVVATGVLFIGKT